MTGDCADLTGQIFGELTALSVTHVGKKRSWMCQCSCGNTRTVQTFQLNAGHVRLCSERKNHLITKIGDRFGKLVVTDINRVGAVGRFTADCVCDCGKTYRTAIKNLQRGSATRCRKCIDYSHRNKLAPGVSLRNMHFGQYKHNAKTKGLEFTLTGEKFDLLTSNNCYFCGTPPKAVMTRKNTLGKRVYNGIDRVDSSLGYTSENCKPCCPECNYFKGNRSNEEFLSRIKQIHEHYEHT